MDPYAWNKYEEEYEENEAGITFSDVEGANPEEEEERIERRAIHPVMVIRRNAMMKGSRNAQLAIEFAKFVGHLIIRRMNKAVFSRKLDVDKSVSIKLAEQWAPTTHYKFNWSCEWMEVWWNTYDMIVRILDRQKRTRTEYELKVAIRTIIYILDPAQNMLRAMLTGFKVQKNKEEERGITDPYPQVDSKVVLSFRDKFCEDVITEYDDYIEAAMATVLGNTDVENDLVAYQSAFWSTIDHRLAPEVGDMMEEMRQFGHATTRRIRLKNIISIYSFIVDFFSWMINSLTKRFIVDREVETRSMHNPFQF